MVDSNLDDMFLARVLRQQVHENEWDQTMLHVSDLCGCPRAAMLRIKGLPKREFTDSETRAKSYMFYLANWLHDEQYHAWAEAGILVEKECTIRGFLPENWVGRFDAIINYGGGSRIADVKTKAFIGKTAQFPEMKHLAQVGCYQMHIAQEWGLTQDPIVYYMQRDLQHYEAKECVVDLSENTISFIKSEMEKLNEAYGNLPELPPVLGRDIRYTGKKVDKQYLEISAVTNKKCETNWCDYSCGESCEPDVGEDLLAYRNSPRDDFIILDDAEPYMGGLQGFFNDQMVADYD